ncbi:MAG TPA: sensor domain-containing diguanylate cyclase [Actinocrinis sp.]|nr:sensor domain-containing diguanylate cyclase [Actinocrinis sp.]
MNAAPRFPRIRPADRAVAAGAAVAALAAAYAAGALLHWGAVPNGPDDGSDSLGELMGDLGLAAGATAAGISCVLRACRARGSLRASWLLFAASASTAGLGNGIWGWYELVLHRSPPSPSAADWVFMLFAPFAMAGILLHHGGLGSVGAWARLGLDGTMIAGALFSAGWAAALARESLAGRDSAYTLVLVLAYPILDILLVSLVLAVRFRGGRSDGPSTTTLVLGYSVIVVCDAVFTVPSVHAGYSSGGLLDAGWFLGYLVLVIAPWMTGWVNAASVPAAHPALRRLAAWTRRSVGVLGVLFPYLAGASCLAGIMVDGLTGGHQVHPVLLTTGGLVLVALVARQAVTLLENASLTRQLAGSEEHFRSLVQGSSDVIVTVDQAGRIGYISPAVTHVFGYGLDQLVGTELQRLVHPQDRAVLAAATSRFLAGPDLSVTVECRIRARRPMPLDGHDSPWRHTESTLTRHHGGLVYTCRDVSDRVALQQQLAYNAYHDSLTGLPNRALFAERLERAVAQRFSGAHAVAVLFLDLDWFKQVNDTGGHAAGDALLVEAAARLGGSVRAGDTVARFGGDEFAALVHTGPDEGSARDVADRLHAELTRPFLIGGRRFTVGASIGVAYWRGGGTAAELMREADLAMYEAKAAGKGRVVSREPSIR